MHHLLRARPPIDLKYRAFERVLHGIRVIGTWLNEGETSSQPCLVLVPARAPLDSRITTLIVIPLNEAWAWAAHNDVGDPVHCMTSITEWLEAGDLPGNPHSKSDCLDVMDCINETLPDLVAMPPRPRLEHDYTIGIMKVKNHTTGKTSEQEVKTNV